MSLMSADGLRAYDVGNPKAEAGNLSLRNPIVSLPLVNDSIDVSEQFPFIKSNSDMFTKFVTRYKSMLDQAYSARTPEELVIKIDHVIAGVPHASGVRDYLLESALLPLIKADGKYSQMTYVERIALLDKAYSAARTTRTKGMLAGELVKVRLETLGPQASYQNKLVVITQIMPQPSSTRDRWINEALNTSLTSWGEIDQAQRLILGHSYRTDENPSAVRSGVMEAVSYGIEMMNVGDRCDLMCFLLDVSQHILRPGELDDNFFNATVKKRMKSLFVGKHHSASLIDYNGKPPVDIAPDLEITEADFETQFESIKQYLIAIDQERKRQGQTYAHIQYGKLPQLKPPFSEIIYKIPNFPQLLTMATPDSLNKFLGDQLTGGHGGEFAATSLGPLFASATPADRRSLMYRMCLGRNGFFEDTHFDDEGKQVIESIIELATTVRKKGVDGATQHNWTPRERDVFKTTAVEVFRVFPPARRTEVLTRLVNLIADNGGQVTRDQLILFCLTSVGGIGAKIGQMDFISQALGVDLGSLKERASPLPKTTIAQILRADGREIIYDGVGESLKSGSVGSVVELRREGEVECGVIAKVIKPEVADNIESDLEIVAIIMRNLNQLGILNVNIDQILIELKEMVKEELNPTLEYGTMKLFREARSYRNPFNVGMPDAIYAGERHLEITKINGKSIADVVEIKARAKRGEKLSKEESEYASLDLVKTYGDLFGDFLFQVFDLGMFHSDMHEGNVWMHPKQGLNEIDYGQTGLEIDLKRRDAMLSYTVGIAMGKPILIAKALQVYDPSLPIEAIMPALTDKQDLAKAATNFISDRHIPGSINRYSKAMVTNAPYIAALKQTARGKLLLAQGLAYYASSRGMLMDIVKLVQAP